MRRRDTSGIPSGLMPTKYPYNNPDGVKIVTGPLRKKGSEIGPIKQANTTTAHVSQPAS